MKIKFAVPALAVLLIASPAWAAEDEPNLSPEQICQEMAKEDQVPQNKMEKYMTWCLEDLAGSKEGANEEGVPQDEPDTPRDGKDH